jgi:LemA protein
MQNTEKIADKAKSENALSGTLKSLFALYENYSKLKANENFLKLQIKFMDTENKIQWCIWFCKTGFL